MDARDHDRFEDVGLVRLTTWATAAAVALTIATLASFTTTGSQRVEVAMAALVGGNGEKPANLAYDRPRSTTIGAASTKHFVFWHPIATAC